MIEKQAEQGDLIKEYKVPVIKVEETVTERERGDLQIESDLHKQTGTIFCKDFSD